jgi:DNA-binding CsgD family transcriptional regulator
LVESVHRLGGTDAAWLEGLVDAASTLDRGLGVVGALQRLEGGVVETLHVAVKGQDAVWRFVERCAAANFPFAHLRDGPLTHSATFRAELGRAAPGGPTLEALCQDLGIRDASGHLARWGDTHFVVLVAPARETIVPTPAERRRWSRATAHLGTGLRLRVRLAAKVPVPEIVLDPRGRALHVSPDALDPECSEQSALTHLGRRAAAMRLARGPLRDTEPDRAMSLWTALVDGRWSLADRIDSDGKHGVVAFRNDLDTPGPSELTARERDVVAWASGGASLKEIAYALGIGLSTVGGLLASAMRKLRVTSRGELATLWAATRTALPGENDVLRVSLDPGEDALAPLSDAERDVARRAARGETTAEIARARGTAESTVTNQLGALFRKLGVGSRAELAARLAQGPRR